MGQILIGKYISVEDLGVYSIALSIASVFTLISTAFQNVWSPYLYENYKKPNFNDSLRKLFSIILLSLIMVSLLLSLFSREIVLLLSNISYLDACQYLVLLCIPMSFYLMFPFASSGVSISRDTKYVGISYVAGSCMNLLLLFITIRSVGVLAVPLCLGVSRITIYIILYKVSEKKIGYTLPNFLFALLLVVVSLCYIAIKLDLSLIFRIILATTVSIVIVLFIDKRYNVKGVLAAIKQSKSNGK